MLKAWIAGTLIFAALFWPVVFNLDNPEKLKRYAPRFLFVGLGSFMLMLLLRFIL